MITSLMVVLASQFAPTGAFDSRVQVDVYMPTWCSTCPQWKPHLQNDAGVKFEFIPLDAPDKNLVRAYPAFYVQGIYLESAHSGMSVKALKDKAVTAMRDRTKRVEAAQLPEDGKTVPVKTGEIVRVEFKVTAVRVTSEGKRLLTLEALDAQGTVPPYHPTFVCDETLVKKK